MQSFACETDADRLTIREVVIAAFVDTPRPEVRGFLVHRHNLGQTGEAKLVETIRNSANFIPELSIVAAEDGEVLRHILFSPIVIFKQNTYLI